jgi:D-glycero-alpha-D-manno-heptose 1-phosphate guanylyltransferase
MSLSDDVTAVILAGGKGTRLQRLQPDTAKPMIRVAGQPFLHWLTLWLARHGLRHFVYSTGYRGAQIELWAANDRFPELRRVCRREAVPLGTGGGLLNCLDLCRDWIVVANGDGLVLGGIAELLALRSMAGVDGGLIGVAVQDATRYGSLAVDETGRLTGFREKVPGKGLVNAGAYLFRATVLRALARNGACSLEYDLFPELIQRGANFSIIPVANAPFIDIGTPETLNGAERFITRHLSGQ